MALDLGIARRVRFHGCLPEDDLIAVLRRGDVFCMPGTAELPSIATMEAMAARLPVVAANAMARPHLVHHGVNGCLYPPGDRTALAAALRDLGTDPAARVAMGTASKRIVARHDLTDTLDAFEDLYLCVQEEVTDHDHTGTAPARPRREHNATVGLG